LLKIVLVNFSYRVGVHMNFSESIITSLVCSPQSEYDCHQAHSWRGVTGQCHPQFQSFQVNKIFEAYVKEILQCKSTKLPQGTILLQLLVEYKLVPNLLINDRK